MESKDLIGIYKLFLFSVFLFVSTAKNKFSTQVTG